MRICSLVPAATQVHLRARARKRRRRRHARVRLAARGGGQARRHGVSGPDRRPDERRDRSPGGCDRVGRRPALRDRRGPLGRGGGRRRRHAGALQGLRGVDRPGRGRAPRAAARGRGPGLLTLHDRRHRRDDRGTRRSPGHRRGGRGADHRDAQPPRPGGLRACRRRSRLRASSSPSGSSHRTLPATGSPTWSPQRVGSTLRECRASPPTGCADPTQPAALEPDVVVLAPCGFDLDRTLSEVVPLDLSAHLLGTPARQESRVFAVDANAMFSRPGSTGRRRRRGARSPAPSSEYPDPGGGLEPGQALAAHLVQANPDFPLVESYRVASGGLVAYEAGADRAGGSASRGRRARARRRALPPSASGLPWCGQALSKAWSTPSTSRTTISRSPASTTARPPVRASARAVSTRPEAASLMRPRLSRPVPLYLREANIEEILSPADAVEAVECCFVRLAKGVVENEPRRPARAGVRPPARHGRLGPRKLHRAGVKTYVGFAEGARFVFALFAADGPELLALIEADRLGQPRTGAASTIAARHLAKPGASTLGLIGTGWPEESQLACIQGMLPGTEQVGRLLAERGAAGGVLRAARLRAGRVQPGCGRAGCGRDDHQLARPGASRRVAAAGRTRVCGGREPDRVARAGQRRPRARQLRLLRLARRPGSRPATSSSPSSARVLDWLEVHELAEVVAGEIVGRRAGRRGRRLQEPRHRGGGRGRGGARLRPRARARARRGGSAQVLAEEVEQQAVVPGAVGATLVLPHHSDPLEADALVRPDRALVGDGGVDGEAVVPALVEEPVGEGTGQCRPRAPARGVRT